MSPSDRALNMACPVITDEIDLGVEDLPAGLDLQALFPKDRLLRLHPNWFVSDFQEKDDGGFTVSIKDYVTEENFLLSGSFTFNRKEGELLFIQLTGGTPLEIFFLNRERRLKVQISSADQELDPDDPVLLWVRAIKEYIRMYLKRTPLTLFFRFFMNKMILKMDPSQRKICLMMAKITAVEMLVILLIVFGYLIFVF